MRASHLLSLVAIFSLSACGGGGGGSGGNNEPNPQATPRAQLQLKSFDATCNDFVPYVANALTEELLQGFRCLADAPCPIFLEADFAVGAPNAPNGGAGGASEDAVSAPDRVSETNVQEAGVDEADIVKIDSSGRIYILSTNKLSIVNAFPPQGLNAQTPVELDLSQGQSGFATSELFLDEDAGRVVVLASRFDQNRSFATTIFVDVSNPAAPAETGRLEVEGFGLEARRIDGRVHRVTRFDVPRPQWLYDGSEPLQSLQSDYFAAVANGDETRAQSIKVSVNANINSRLQSQGVDALLPEISAQSSGQSRASQTLACNQLSAPDVTTGLGFAVIDSFDQDGANRGTSAIVNNAYTVYASRDNLFLAQSSFGWFFAPVQDEESVIYRFELSDSGAAQYRGLGKVPGSILNRFALSEHENHLRVATTISRFGPGGDASTNHLWILRSDGLDLPQVASVEGFAPGERIQGARFLGDRGFVVTFRQIDPLFAFDLSIPTAPRIASELKIPGFSSYLAPVGEDYLLTVGRDGTDERLTGAVAVQLFDVSDLENVSPVASIAPTVGDFGYSYSPAEHDPHAFSYFSDSDSAATPGTLSIPLISYGDTDFSQFTGFLVVRVDPGADRPLSESGRIEHSQFLSDRGFCEFSPNGDCAFAYVSADPRRSLFAQGDDGIVLYTISAVGIRADDALQPGNQLGALPIAYDPPLFFERPVVVPGGGGVVAEPALGG